MKLLDLLVEIDRGDLELHATVANREQATATSDDPLRGHWLIDSKTGKRLSGPFKTSDAALSFKKNRPDKIPDTARVVRQ